MSNKSSTVAEIGDHLATIDMGQKVGAAVPLFLEGGRRRSEAKATAGHKH